MFVLFKAAKLLSFALSVCYPISCNFDGSSTQPPPK